MNTAESIRRFVNTVRDIKRSVNMALEVNKTINEAADARQHNRGRRRFVNTAGDGQNLLKFDMKKPPPKNKSM